LRLNPGFRRALYAALAALFITGAAWLAADQFKELPSGEIWQSVAANLLMMHGGTAMLALMLLGALFPIHVRLSWRNRRNRAMGILLMAVGGILIATAFGLYYSGLDILRSWMSWIHTIIGLALPVVILAHVVTGRRSGQT
jgi:hypothetical protein